MGRNSKGKISSPHFIFGRLFCLVSDLTLLRFPDTEENASQTQRSWTSRKLVIGPPFFWIFSINVSWFTHVYIEIPPSWRRSSVANWKLWKGLSIIFLLMQRLFWIQNHIKPVPGGSTDIWSQKADTLKYGLSYIFLAFTFIKQTEQNEKHVAWKLM